MEMHLHWSEGKGSYASGPSAITMHMRLDMVACIDVCQPASLA